jgi:hypothetical protein
MILNKFRIGANLMASAVKRANALHGKNESLALIRQN